MNLLQTGGTEAEKLGSLIPYMGQLPSVSDIIVIINGRISIDKCSFKCMGMLYVFTTFTVMRKLCAEKLKLFCM